MYVGLGSNIDAEANLHSASARLKGLWPDIRCSSVWRSQARDVVDQPDFLNAVCRFETDASPESIVLSLQTIEQTLKKNIPFRYGPRTIDLDLLLVDDLVLPSKLKWHKGSKLFLPHPRLHERRFVLEPLIELAGEDFLHPVLKRPLKKFLEQVKEQKCEKVEIQLQE